MEKPKYIYQMGKPLTVDISGSVGRHPDIWAQLSPGDTISEGDLTFKILSIELPSKMVMEWVPGPGPT